MAKMRRNKKDAVRTWKVPSGSDEAVESLEKANSPEIDFEISDVHEHAEGSFADVLANIPADDFAVEDRLEDTSKSASADRTAKPDDPSSTRRDAKQDAKGKRGRDSSSKSAPASNPVSAPAASPKPPLEFDTMARYMSESTEYGALPHPELFNAYPPEVQRKIMEWTDRDVKSRREDVSRREDELLRAEVERQRMRQYIPALIIIVALVCAALIGFFTRNTLLALAFVTVAFTAVIGIIVVSRRPPQE